MSSRRDYLLLMCRQMTSMARAAATSSTSTRVSTSKFLSSPRSAAFPPGTVVERRRLSHGSPGAERTRLLAQIQERLERGQDKSLESYIRAFERAHAKEMSTSELQELNIILNQTDEMLTSCLVRINLPDSPV
eukprot:1520222-Rhodomonas_salina.3